MRRHDPCPSVRDFSKPFSARIMIDTLLCHVLEETMRLTRTRSLVAVATAAALSAAIVVTAQGAGAATAGCQVSYTISSQWQGGFGANIAVTNLGDPISGWTLRWSF